MITTHRFDIYAPIHKAMRLFMSDTLLGLGRMDLADEQDLNSSMAQLEALLDAASFHIKHENDFIHPAIEARCTGVSGRIAEEHREHLEAISTLRNQASALRAAPDAALAHRLYRQLAAFIAENFEHMDVEETRHNQALWAAYTDAELQASAWFGRGPSPVSGEEPEFVGGASLIRTGDLRIMIPSL